MKWTKDKKALLLRWYHERVPMYELALRLHTTRATLYRWLREEGVILARQGREPGVHKRSSKCGLMAETMGVSMPTARKYMGVLADAELAGIITPEELKKIGLGEVQQKIVLAFLQEAGYSYDATDMSLDKESEGVEGLRFLTVHEAVELFTDPGRFLDESTH